jgi:4-hydroxy-tetrahydrodipicolinate synthase
MAQLDGINLTMQTPMHDNGSFDYTRWEALIDIYIDAGVQELVAAG